MEISGALLANSRPRVIAALMRNFGDLDTAEDLFQEACLRASERWPRDGAPRDHVAWMIAVARNAGLDRIRKDRCLISLDADTPEPLASANVDLEAEMAEAVDRSEYRDDVLRLMFMCCHPELRGHEQLALALKVVAGLSLEEIARAFVVSPDTMQRRLSRAKARASQLAAGLDMQGFAERAMRLSAVQTTIYLIFNEGYAASGGDTHIRASLCDEAIRLARLLVELFPGQAESMGLLSLCLLQHARMNARLDHEGRLVPLEAQQRSLWDAAKIAEGRVLVEKALLHGRPGSFQIQAAIAALHCAAGRAEETDWAEIERLYAALEIIAPGPVARLNRAVAMAKLKGAGIALAMIEPLAEELARYQPFHAVRAALLEESGAFASAIEAIDAALACRPTRQERIYLNDKRAVLSERLLFTPP